VIREDVAPSTDIDQGESMPAQRFVEQLNVQIGHEFAAHQQYVACAVYYDALTMPQMAGFFYAQALEERGHAMMMVQYLVDQDAEVTIPGVAAPQTRFADIVEPVALALEQEKRVTQQINQLTRISREEYDFASDQFMQWFIKEQVEEVATMSDLLTVVKRAKHDVEAIEDYVQRETTGEAADPTAPAVAGA
jgi:bacterioferritin B